MWSIVWSLVPHKQFGVSNILNLRKYELIFPYLVTMVVKLSVMFIFIFSLSATIGKYSFVICFFVVWSQSLCHFSTLFSPSSLLTNHKLLRVWAALLQVGCVIPIEEQVGWAWSGLEIIV
jgi:hypothetical protein